MQSEVPYAEKIGANVINTFLRRFSPIFSEEIGVLLESQCYDQYFA
jgi:hypothetical protein